MIGIYKITNLVNGKVYIGCSSWNIKKRWTFHKQELKNDRHINKHLQKSYNKYGRTNFRFEIIELCDKEIVPEREKYWINFYISNDYRYGYNKTVGGDSSHLVGELNPFYGKKHKPGTFENRTNDHFKGRKHSEETKRKMSEKRKGRKMSPESIEKSRQAHIGVKMSRETILKRNETRLKNGTTKPVVIIISDKDKNQIIEMRKSGCTLLEIQTLFGFKSDYLVKRTLKEFKIGSEYNPPRKQRGSYKKRPVILDSSPEESQKAQILPIDLLQKVEA